MEPYKLPICVAEAEFTEKRSRFICNITPVRSEDEALSFLYSIRMKYRDATHNVYSYRLKSNGICRHSDDGEPSGTAGMPLLNVFIKQDVYDFCCIATRYFGGIMLGAGGLVRAYARCGTLALETSGVGLMSEISLCSMTIPYTLYEVVKRFLNARGADVISEDFGAEVEIKFSLLSDEVPEFNEKLSGLTSGLIHTHVEEKRIDRIKG